MIFLEFSRAARGGGGPGDPARPGGCPAGGLARRMKDQAMKLVAALAALALLVLWALILRRRS